jgi:hypothetical protein
MLHGTQIYKPFTWLLFQSRTQVLTLNWNLYPYLFLQKQICLSDDTALFISMLCKRRMTDISNFLKTFIELFAFPTVTRISETVQYLCRPINLIEITKRTDAEQGY